MNRQSKRFTPSKWVERLMPVVFILLALALLFAIALVVLSVLGQVPRL